MIVCPSVWSVWKLLEAMIQKSLFTDRDINQIWRELQELEKLPNGGYRPRSTPPYSTATPSKTTPITPVKVKASYVAKPMTVTPTTQRRTIWDYEQENNNKIEANSSPIARPPRSQLPPPPPLPPHLRPSQPPKSVTIGNDQFWIKSWQFCTPEGVFAIVYARPQF